MLAQPLRAESESEAVPSVMPADEPAVRKVYCNVCRARKAVVEEPTADILVCSGCLNPLYLTTAGARDLP